MGQPGLPGSPLPRLLPLAMGCALGLQYGTGGPERPWGLTADPARGWKLREGQVPVMVCEPQGPGAHVGLGAGLQGPWGGPRTPGGRGQTTEREPHPLGTPLPPPRPWNSPCRWDNTGGVRLQGTHLGHLSK